MATRFGERDVKEIRDVFVGRRIVAAERGDFRIPNVGYSNEADGRLTLDDGTQVYVVPNQGGCSCGAGDYELANLAAVDNVITDVRVADVHCDMEYSEDAHSYRLYVVADAVEVNAVQVDGDDGNGYYGTGFELVVVGP